MRIPLLSNKPSNDEIARYMYNWRTCSKWCVKSIYQTEILIERFMFKDDIKDLEITTVLNPLFRSL